VPQRLKPTTTVRVNQAAMDPQELSHLSGLLDRDVELREVPLMLTLSLIITISTENQRTSYGAG
jgi:hypothetical protein